MADTDMVADISFIPTAHTESAPAAAAEQVSPLSISVVDATPSFKWVNIGGVQMWALPQIFFFKFSRGSDRKNKQARPSTNE